MTISHKSLILGAVLNAALTAVLFLGGPWAQRVAAWFMLAATCNVSSQVVMERRARRSYPPLVGSKVLGSIAVTPPWLALASAPPSCGCPSCSRGVVPVYRAVVAHERDQLLLECNHVMDYSHVGEETKAAIRGKDRLPPFPCFACGEEARS